MPKPAANKLKNDQGGLHVSWMTVSYRSVIVTILLIIAAIFGATYLVFPGPTGKAVDKTKNVLEDWGTRLGIIAPARPTTTATSNQAHFTNLDGTVEVRRKGKNDWEKAGYNVPLERGDTIRTSEGMAKVTFPDGTSYVVKPESYIVVEENSTDAGGNSKVVVEVQGGTADLHAGNFGQGSKSKVVVGDANADLTPGTSAIVVSAQDQHELTVRDGQAQVTRSNGDIAQLEKNEKVAFQGEGSHMVKEKEIVPPTLIAPMDQLPFSLGPDGYTNFTWAPADDAKAYHLVISKNSFMSPALVNKQVPTTSTRVAGLEEGTYYWSVRSINSTGRESAESARNKFSIVPKTQHAATLALEVEDPIKTGHTVEIIGKTEPGARVVVNAEEVPLVDSSDGTFHYFLTGLPNGPNTITITAQKGQGVHTEYKTVDIP